MFNISFLALCPDPLGPAFCNATFCNATLTGYSVGDNITYNCNPGFETEGAETITCQSDGTWSDNPPACKSTLGKRNIIMLVHCSMQNRNDQTAVMNSINWGGNFVSS